MAVTFRRGPRTLLQDLQDGGFEPLASSTLSPSGAERELRIPLANGTTVNWDRDSKSVWAEGPWEIAQKVEHYLSSLYEASWVEQQWRQNRTVIVATGLSVASAFVLAVLLSLLI